jgi:hypothetical protein
VNTTNSKRHSATPTDDGTRVAYAEASKSARAAADALERALRDPALIPSALLAPPVLDRATGQTRCRPWSTRGVTAPRARRVLDYATRQYLAGYSKVEAGSRWTRSSGEAPHLPLIRQTCRALGLNERSGSNRSTIGAVYGYLDALGVLAYEGGKSDRYSYLAYGPVALEGRSLAAPSHRVSGGIPQHYGRGTTPALGDTKRGSIREEKTLPAQSQREPVAENGKSEISTKQKQTPEIRLNADAAQFLKVLVGSVSSYGRGLDRRLDGYEKHAALLAQSKRWAAMTKRSGVGHDANRLAVTRLNLGESNLDAADNLPSLLAHLLGKHYEAAEHYLARHAEAAARDKEQKAYFYESAGVEVHGGDEPYTYRGGEEPAPLASALADLDLFLPPGEYVGADAHTAVAVGAIAAGSAVAEMRPAYETGEPLRSRLIGDAVRQGQHLGYGIPEEEATALHAYYLDLRQAGALDPETDLYEIQHALGRPLHLAEAALYGLSFRVSAAQWEQAETYTGGAAYPEPVEVRGVSLAGTAVAQ